ncbi:MAG TPA: hypothetical protein VND94_08635 [Terriglobia bacterium]|nr:hypothetical protein [Terriglobia bacterium]
MLIDNLGAVALHGPRFQLNKLNEDGHRQAQDYGFQAARAGKEGIERLFSGLRDRFLTSRGAWGPNHVYGRLSMWLAHETTEKVYDPLRDMMFDFTHRTFPVGPDDMMFGRHFPSRLVHSIYSASTQSGLYPDLLRRLFLKLEFYPTQHSGLSADRIMFPAAPAQRILDDLAGSLNFREVLETINIGRPQLDALHSAGILTPDIVHDLGEFQVRGFSRQNLDAFIDALRSGATPVQEISDQLMPIPDASRRACCKAAETVRLILDGRLTRKGLLTTGTGYMAILVDPEEIKPMVRRADHGGVSLRQAEKHLGVSTRVLTALIVNDYLPSREAINPGNRCAQRVVDLVDLDAFRSTYISLTELASKLRAYPGDLAPRLAAKGLQLAFPLDVIHASYYHRQDVSALKIGATNEA